MRSPLRRGFTLIELLTVIAIIGILAAVLFPAAMGVQKRARIATSQTALSGWGSGVVRYKQAYGYYPILNVAGSPFPTADTAYRLESGANAANVGAIFVMALSGRNPNGSILATGLAGNRAKYNRNAEGFVEFSRDDYEDITKFPAPSDITGSIGPGNFLIDRLGNRNIRVVIDFTGDGFLRSVTPPLGATGVPSEVRLITGATGVPGRVLIYTSNTDATSIDAASAAVGTERSDFANIISLQ